MSQEIINKFTAKYLRKPPEIRSGYTVRVHQRIKEGSKERVQVFEGLVIKVGAGRGINKTFTVRKIVSGVGVEKAFPIHAHNITKIEVTKKSKVRRAKLYYMRHRSGKSARLYQKDGKTGEITDADTSVVEEMTTATTTEQ